jgi:hypothetical protein
MPNVFDTIDAVVRRQIPYWRTGRIPTERAEDILDAALTVVSKHVGRPLIVRPRRRVLYRVLALKKRVKDELFKLGGQPGSSELYQTVITLIEEMLAE